MSEPKVFSLTEVSVHTSKKDCWVVIGGKVYDVTNFLEEHPGGEEVLLEAAASGDATKAFEEVGHSSTATAMMDSYLIGALESSNPRAAPIPKISRPNEQERSFVSATKTAQQKRPPSTSALLDFLLPFIALGLAIGVWYFYNRTKESTA